MGVNQFRSRTYSRVIVLGGTGFVGKHLARRWTRSDDHPLCFLVHRSHPVWLEDMGIETCLVDLGDHCSVAAAFDGAEIIINLLRPDGKGWYPSLFERLTQLLDGTGIRRCVHTSSIDVYHGSNREYVDERTSAAPLTRHECEHVAVERILESSFPEVVVMRLGAVFGSGGRNILALADEMHDAPDWKLALRRSLYGRRRMHLVSVESVVDALAEAAFHSSQQLPHLAIVTEDAAEQNNFAFVQNILAAQFGRRLFDKTPALPAKLLRTALRFRGLPAAVATRRYSDENAASFKFEAKHFEARLRAYAAELAAEKLLYSA